jgi:enoyl-CoA hydratase/carnithine racemase
VPDFETILYDVRDGVGWLTLNRPEVHNAFNEAMRREVRSVWASARHDDDVRCIVVTGAGDKAFCTGIDRAETIGDSYLAEDGGSGDGPAGRDPWHFDDPASAMAPKSCDLWKPVIAAVNGMACGGAFYLLGEVEFVIAAEHATFFDPHVTYGMTAAFEPTHLLQKMPFGEVMRLALLGSYERMTAARACEMGLVSEVVPADALEATARWAAQAIADQPALAIGGTVRALWAARELSRTQALGNAYLYTGLGTRREVIAEGQAKFASGGRIEPKLR